MSLQLNSERIAVVVMRVVEKMNFNDIIAVRDVCNEKIIRQNQTKELKYEEWNHSRMWYS